jgi:hypothetical protein
VQHRRDADQRPDADQETSDWKPHRG